MENTPRADVASPAMRTTSAAARRAISIPLANNSTVRLATKTHPPLETLTPLRYCGGDLRAKTQRDPLVRLDVNDKLICARIFDRSFTEQHKRRAAEVDRNFGYALGQPLAGAKIKWHIAPAPVIDFQLQRDKSFRVGVR